MSSCCHQPREQASSVTPITVALAGNPNCGKTTLFNALTGLRQKVANYPGITVERKTGRCKLPDGRSVEIVDLPGTYSLISRSPDELVAMEVIRGLRNDTKIPDAVIVVVDASNLQRNLYLVSQLIELGRPLVIALNMMDVAERRGMHVSAEALERELGVPVVPVVGHKRQGIDQLKAAIAQARVAPMPDWPLPQVMREELVVVGGGLAILDSGDDDRPRPHVPKDERFRPAERYQALAERLLIGDHASDLSEIAAREPVASLLKSATQRMGDVGVDPMQADIEAHYGWIEQVASRCVATIDELAAMGNPAPPSFAQHSALSTQRWLNWSEQIDSILIHRVWGLVIFALIMASLFVTIFWLARPIMDGIDTSIHWLAGIVSAAIPDGPIRDLVKDGIFAGVGTVIVFVPQIALLFLFLAILEDSGYLARAAFLMDRVLSKVGLHGKSFIPLLSSFACAIPGILATRTIENRKDRLATILVTPFMSCSARLPVYTLLIGVFFASYGAFAQAGIMLSLYTLGILTAAIIAWLFKGTLLRGPTPAFILEMPSYKLPQVGQVLRQVWTNTREFLTKAGTIIFCMSVVLWAITYYPQPSAAQIDGIHKVAVEHNWDSATLDKAIQAAHLDNSIAGRIGRGMEPVLQPLGYNWKMGVGLVGAFAAREVFVSTMGIIYSVGDVGDHTAPLAEAMRADMHPDGTPVWTPLVAMSLLVWFVLAMQCMSTLAIVRRETGSWRWPLFMLVYMNTLAYVVCLVIYQIGSRWV